VPGANHPSADEETLAALGDELAGAVVAAVPGWVEREVARVYDAWDQVRPDGGAGPSERAAVLAAAAEAGRRAAQGLDPTLRALLAADVDSQQVTPLQLVAELVGFPSAVLEAAGVPPVERDAFAEARFPDDVYGLTPASLGTLDPALAEPALHWGAAKAMTHRRRHGTKRFD